MSARQVVAAIALLLAALALGWWGRGALRPEHAAGEGRLESSGAPCPDGAVPVHWRAPMDPTYIRDAPGKSPMGMDLLPVCPGAVEGVVRIDPGAVQKFGVRTAQVEARELAHTVRAVGRVAYDERLVAHVHTKVQGWVERLFVEYEGQEVRRGEPLLEIYSPELVATQDELLVAARYRAATSQSPFPDVSRGGSSLFEATKRRMELWDIPDRDIERLVETGEIQKNLTLYAPASGVVTHMGVRRGMEVGPHDNLYTIADLSSVWVLADVYEFELPWVELGQAASFELSYLPGSSFSGPVTYVSPFLDPATRTAQVRVELPNPDGRFKPEMFGNTLLHGRPRQADAVIPTEAVIRSGRRTLVVVALGEGRYEPRPVELGVESGDGLVEVTRGLRAGESVVVSSQFLIDSESRLQEALQKLMAGSE